jgi:hypothetical protein
MIHYDNNTGKHKNITNLTRKQQRESAKRFHQTQRLLKALAR